MSNHQQNILQENLASISRKSRGSRVSIYSNKKKGAANAPESAQKPAQMDEKDAPPAAQEQQKSNGDFQAPL